MHSLLHGVWVLSDFSSYATQEISVGFNLTFNLHRNIYMLKKKVDIIQVYLIFHDVVNESFSKSFLLNVLFG